LTTSLRTIRRPSVRISRNTCSMVNNKTRDVV
jgi:hypothetical protein